MQGGGTLRRAHSTPAANSPHKVGFVFAPCPLAPGKLQQSPQKGEGCSVESLGSAGPLLGASQRAESRHPARRCVSRAIAGCGSLSGARGSVGSPWAASKGQSEVNERLAPAAGSPPRTSCSMGSGAARTGEGCFAAVRLGSRGPGQEGGGRIGGEEKSGGSRSLGPRTELDARDKASASASWASPRRAARRARGCKRRSRLRD